MSTTYILPPDRGLHLPRVGIALAKTSSLPDAHAVACDDFGYGSAAALFLKTAVGAGSTTNSVWAGGLTEHALSDDFLTYPPAQSLSEQIPFRRADFMTRTIVEIEGPTLATWVGEGRPKPIGSNSFATVTLSPFKVVSPPRVLTNETLGSSSAEVAVRQVLSNAHVAMINQSLLDASPATGARPAGLLYGITPIASTGSPSADRAALIAAFEGDLSRAVFIMSPEVADSINRDGLLDLGARGGTWATLPVVVSNFVPSDSSGSTILLIDPSMILLAAGPVEISGARHATIEMLDNPVGDSVMPVSASQVSLFQTDSSALLAERFVSWVPVPGAVAAVSGCKLREHVTMSDPRPREKMIVEVIMSVVAEMMNAKQESIDARIAALEARIAALESLQHKTLADAFQGPHLAGKTYSRGDLVQRSRRYWLALTQTDARPGESGDWREFGPAERA